MLLTVSNLCQSYKFFIVFHILSFFLYIAINFHIKYIMVNKVILIGNVGADPEVRSLESGVKMARIRVATTERYFSSTTGEKKEHTEWHSVTLWRSQADFAERYIQKGTQVYVEGRIRSRELNDIATGAKRTVVEIHADDIKTLSRRATTTEAVTQPAPIENATPNPDNLPF